MVHSSRFIAKKQARFYCSDSGREPVRDWLKALSSNNRKRIGRDITTLQLGWPLGMPLARKLEPGLWEIRTRLDNSIARVLFSVRNDTIVLLHGYIKKTQKTPTHELRLARRRMETL
jgi:phage-related protein